MGAVLGCAASRDLSGVLGVQKARRTLGNQAKTGDSARTLGRG